MPPGDPIEVKVARLEERMDDVENAVKHIPDLSEAVRDMAKEMRSLKRIQVGMLLLPIIILLMIFGKVDGVELLHLLKALVASTFFYLPL